MAINYTWDVSTCDVYPTKSGKSKAIQEQQEQQEQIEQLKPRLRHLSLSAMIIFLT